MTHIQNFPEMQKLGAFNLNAPRVCFYDSNRNIKTVGITRSGLKVAQLVVFIMKPHAHIVNNALEVLHDIHISKTTIFVNGGAYV